MNTFQLVLPRNKQPLPVELAVLTAPVFVDEPSLAGEYVGQTEGVLLDHVLEDPAMASAIRVADLEVVQGKTVELRFGPLLPEA